MCMTKQIEALGDEITIYIWNRYPMSFYFILFYLYYHSTQNSHRYVYVDKSFLTNI